MKTQAIQKKYRLAILLSHPIHYLVDFYQELHRDTDIETMVYFCSDFGIRAGYDSTFNQRVRWYDDSILDGLPHKFLKNFSPRSSVGGFFSIINPGIVQELKNGKFDAILIHSYTQCTSWMAWHAAQKLGIPILFRGESFLLNKRPRVTLKLKDVLVRLFFKKVFAFLAIGSLNKEYLKAYGASEHRIISAPYVAAPPRKDEFGEVAALKESLGINKDDVVILSIGKLIPRKGPMDLVRAFELLTSGYAPRLRQGFGGQANPKPRLLFVGDGPEREKIENYSKEKNLRVICVGFMPPEKLPLYYSIADIFALPSYFETWGLVINEAMSYGLPIVTTKMTGAAYDIVREGENGFVHQEGDIDLLKVQIEKLVTNPELRKKFGAASLKIISHWSYVECAEGFKKAMERAGMNVVVIDPGSQHLSESAIAFKKAGILRKYLTGIFYDHQKFPFRLLKLLPQPANARLEYYLKKRERSGLKFNEVKTFGFYEWVYLLGKKVFPGQAEKLIGLKNERFGIAASNFNQKTRPRIVFAPLTSALRVFGSAEKIGAFRILDQFIGHPLNLNKALEKEVAQNPRLKNVIKDFSSEKSLELCRREIEMADLIITGSEFAKKTLIENRVPDSKIAVVPYGADIEMFQPRENKQIGSELKLLFVGNISVRKGSHYLLEAVRELRLKGHKIKLIMAGPMENNWFLRQYGDCFAWIPPLPRSKMTNIYKEADVYVFPSLFEGSSLSIYEAMAAGLPIITTYESGSVVRDGKDGFIIPSKDLDELKKKILFFLNNPDAIETMGESARKRAEEYTWERYYNTLIETIRAKLT
ncbi:MAG: glycosyltransferase family 4 protein [Candidatus Liptonbacteria bacterium]|nr:glycosyltransferase family 4 protein [Candidatus Liptonbacteria bacterium]